MSEDRTPDNPPQVASTGLGSRQKAGNLVEALAGPLLDRVWVAEKPGDILGGFYNATWQGLSPNTTHYFACCTIRPGSKTRSNDTFEAAMVFVLDDIVTLKDVKANDHCLMRDHADMFAPAPNAVVQTSPHKFQYFYRIEPVVTDFVLWNCFCRAMKLHPVWGEARFGASAVQFYRTGTGINNKNSFATRVTQPYDGGSYTLDELIRAFNVDMAAAAKTSRGSGTGETCSVAAAAEIMAMLPNDKGFDDRNLWLRVAYALDGALGEADGRQIFIEWSETHHGSRGVTAGEAERVWDTLDVPKGSASTLRKIVEERFGRDSIQCRRAGALIAFEKVDPDDPTIPATIGAAGDLPPTHFDRTDWNPWERRGGPAFPLDALPDTVRRYAEERAWTTGSDVSAFAMSALLGISSCLDHRTVLQPKVHDPHYLVSPLLWAVLVGDPSTRKTAPIKAVEAVLLQLDMADQRQREFDVQVIEQSGVSRREAETRVPPARRRVLNDATSEKLCAVLSGQMSGIGLFRDELSGWIGAMDKYGGTGKGASQDRSVWIKAYDGGPYTQDRMQHSRSVRNLSCSIMAAIQMGKLLKMGELDSDGLLQRFDPVMMDRPQSDEDVERDVRAVAGFERLLKVIDGMAPATYTLDAGARAVRKAFADEMLRLSRTTEPSMAFGTWLGKKEKTFCALTLILHVADIAADVSGKSAFMTMVPEATARRALKIVEAFLLPHAHLFYTGLAQSHQEMLQNLAVALIRLAGKRVTRTDIDRISRAARGMGAYDFVKTMLVFQSNGWAIAAEPWNPLNKYWWVNPDISTVYAKEAEEHRKNAEAISEKIGGKK